jgi:hypothetical protein
MRTPVTTAEVWPAVTLSVEPLSSAKNEPYRAATRSCSVSPLRTTVPLPLPLLAEREACDGMLGGSFPRVQSRTTASSIDARGTVSPPAPLPPSLSQAPARAITMSTALPLEGVSDAAVPEMPCARTRPAVVAPKIDRVA